MDKPVGLARPLGLEGKANLYWNTRAKKNAQIQSRQEKLYFSLSSLLVHPKVQRRSAQRVPQSGPPQPSVHITATGSLPLASRSVLPGRWDTRSQRGGCAS